MNVQKTPEPIKEIEAALAQAIELALQVIPCFPCLANKAPACPGGFKAASIDPMTLKNLWQRYPGPLIGVPTGEVSGFDVLDMDPRHGGDKWLEANRHRLPAATVHATRSGGWHYLFQHHPGLRNSASRIAPGVDVRANGGYIIWWPTTGLPVFSHV